MDTIQTTDTSSDDVNLQVPPRFAELRNLVNSMEQDFTKFFIHGNKAAGTRVRAAMQELKGFAQTVRAEVLARRSEGKPE